jgi:polyribonucleotide nucleotidyltransferase
MQKTEFTTSIGDTVITAELSDLAARAEGSVMLKAADTTVLVTAVMSDVANQHVNFFPLTVEFEEKFYAAGAILGSRFQRREGRPSEEAVLSARRIDRAIRPRFDQRIRHDIQIVATVLAIGEQDPDILGILGASIALSVSPIPWDGPINPVRIGRERETQEYVVNPHYSRRRESLDLELIACGADDTLNMIEVAGEELPEPDVIDAFTYATAIHRTLHEFQTQIVASHGRAAYNLDLPITPPELLTFFQHTYADRIHNAIFSGQTGKRHLDALKHEFISDATDRGIGTHQECETCFEHQIDTQLHAGVVHEHTRADGRALHEIRPLYAHPGGMSDVLHGSGIFYRGETHTFSALTLGSPRDALAIDTIEAQDATKYFIHHYNFPPFAVGETGRVGGFNRRMIGHGALAEAALRPVIPTQHDFPYTVRVVSETLSSNGSSSMGAVCAASLALMDGGVPITRPVGGIALGAMIDGAHYKILTDIQGPEDEHGDMDLKIAGTRSGITAMQMDVKVDGISLPLLTDALEHAHTARHAILDVIEKAIDTPRAHLSSHAPHIQTYSIDPAQIGLVVGSGGKTINHLKDVHQVDDISIDDDGTVYVVGTQESVVAAINAIERLTKTYAVGESYTATITRITDYGAFATFDDGGGAGLIHISEIAERHVASVDEVLSVGDQVPVQIIKNERGKIALSIKAREPNFGA